jgi:hypothetical protein
MKSLDQETVEHIASLKIELLKEIIEFYGEDLGETPNNIYKYFHISDSIANTLPDWNNHFTDNLTQIFKQRSLTDGNAPNLNLSPGGNMAGAAGRNNNPGNITCTRDHQYYGQEGKDGRWPHFKHVAYGIRAWFSYIERWRQKPSSNTLETLWYIYAPPSENNTQKYIDSLAKACGVSRTAILPPVVSNKQLYWTLGRACFKFECGYVPTDEVMNTAWDMFVQNPTLV